MPERPSDAHKILKEANTVREETRQAFEQGLFKESEQRVFQPLFDVDYGAETQDITQGDNRIMFTRTEIDEHDREQLVRYIKYLQKDTKIEGSYLDVNNWYAVDKLEYRIGETDFDIFGYLPDGYKILFCPSSELYNGAVYREKKVIYIAGDILSLGSISTILHEIGHVKNDERLERLGRAEFAEGCDWEEYMGALCLLEEREASLFALRKMWKELRKNDQIKKDMLFSLSNLAYGSHCEVAFRRIASARIMAHHSPYDIELDMAEELEREWLDAWDKFRKSDEYQEWKGIAEFAQLDENAEYGEWRAWAEKTGKIDDPEFNDKYFGQ